MRTMFLIAAAGLAGFLGSALPAQAQFYRYGFYGRPYYRPYFGFVGPYRFPYYPPPVVYAPPPVVYYAPPPLPYYAQPRAPYYAQPRAPYYASPGVVYAPRPRREPRPHPVRPVRRIQKRPVNPLLGPIAPTQTRALLHDRFPPERRS